MWVLVTRLHSTIVKLDQIWWSLSLSFIPKWSESSVATQRVTTRATPPPPRAPLSPSLPHSLISLPLSIREVAFIKVVTFHHLNERERGVVCFHCLHTVCVCASTVHATFNIFSLCALHVFAAALCCCMSVVCVVCVRLPPFSIISDMPSPFVLLAQRGCCWLVCSGGGVRVCGAACLNWSPLSPPLSLSYNECCVFSLAAATFTLFNFVSSFLLEKNVSSSRIIRCVWHTQQEMWSLNPKSRFQHSVRWWCIENNYANWRITKSTIINVLYRTIKSFTHCSDFFGAAYSTLRNTFHLS